jgi:hypothetical protein
VDTHTFQKTVRTLESLPESARARALNIGERLNDDERGELAARLTHFNERIREKEAEAEKALVAAEQNLTQAEQAFRKVRRAESEMRGQERDIERVEKKLNTDNPPRNP